MQIAIMTKFAKIIYNHFFPQKYFLKNARCTEVSNEFIDLEDQTTSISSSSSLIFFFRWPLVDVLNEVKAYTPAQLDKTP